LQKFYEVQRNKLPRQLCTMYKVVVAAALYSSLPRDGGVEELREEIEDGKK